MSRGSGSIVLGALLLGTACAGGPSTARDPLTGTTSAASAGRILALGERLGDDAPIPVTQGIVDVNGVIEVHLDKKNIERAIPSEWTAEFPPERLRVLKELSQAVEEGQKGLQPLRDGLRAWAAKSGTPEATEALQGVFSAYAQPFEVLSREVEGRPVFAAKFIERMERLPDGFSQVEQDAVMVELAGEIVQQEQAAWRTFLEANGHFFQLGAWLVGEDGNLPIHLPDFDDYPEQEYFEVERWSIRFDATQQREFESLATRAKELNQNLVQPGGYFRAYRDTLVASLKNALETCGKELKETLQKIVDAQLANLDPQPADVLRKAEEFAETLRRMKEKYEGLDPKDPVEVLSTLGNMRDDLRGVKSDFESLLDSAKDLARAITETHATLPQAVIEALSKNTTCVDELRKGLSKFLAALGVDLAASELNADLLEFTDQVKRHTLDSLPESTEFDLHTSGRREAGDRVILKFAAGRGRVGDDGKPDPKPERKVLETRRLTLYRIQPYLGTTVGLIWANPSVKAGLTRDYQAAASYSVLYKWGSRESEAWNSLWSPGIGLNLSALDLDKDDNPELGVGAVFSVVRDYVQIGYGYDPSADETYWFFGFRLPLPTWTLPGQGVDARSP